MAARVTGIRGATTLDEDTSEQVFSRVQALVREMLDANGVANEDLVSVILTATDDIRSAFPATAARALGLDDVPLLGARELGVEGAPQRVVRVLVHAYSSRPRGEIRHVYLEGATGLRPDLT